MITSRDICTVVITTITSSVTMTLVIVTTVNTTDISMSLSGCVATTGHYGPASVVRALLGGVQKS